MSKKLARSSVEPEGNGCLGAGENLLKHFFFFFLGKVRKGRTQLASVGSYAACLWNPALVGLFPEMLVEV